MFLLIEGRMVNLDNVEEFGEANTVNDMYCAAIHYKSGKYTKLKLSLEDFNSKYGEAILGKSPVEEVKEKWGVFERRKGYEDVCVAKFDLCGSAHHYRNILIMQNNTPFGYIVKDLENGE